MAEASVHPIDQYQSQPTDDSPFLGGTNKDRTGDPTNRTYGNGNSQGTRNNDDSSNMRNEENPGQSIPFIFNDSQNDGRNNSIIFNITHAILNEYTDQPSYTKYSAVKYVISSGLFRPNWIQTPEITIERSNIGTKAWFFRKIFAILCFQFLIMAISGELCSTEFAKQIISQNMMLIYITSGAATVMAPILMVLTIVTNKLYLKIFYLFCFALALAFVLGSLVGGTSSVALSEGIIATGVACLVVTIYLFIVRSDLRGYTPYIISFVVVWIVFGVYAGIYPSEIIQSLIATAASWVYIWYLIFGCRYLTYSIHVKPSHFLTISMMVHFSIFYYFYFIYMVILLILDLPDTDDLIDS